MSYITTQQAAGILGVTPQWIANLCQKGGLLATKPGRDWQVDEDSVRAYLERVLGGEIKRRGKRTKGDEAS